MWSHFLQQACVLILPLIQKSVSEYLITDTCFTVDIDGSKTTKKICAQIQLTGQ
jgi:hypothetical protein